MPHPSRQQGTVPHSLRLYRDEWDRRMRRVPHPFRAFCGMGGNQSAPVSPRPTAGGPPEVENENSPGCSPPRRTKPWDSKPIREGRRPEGQPRFSAAPTASPIFRAPECVSMRSNHAEIRAKCVENTSQNGCFAYEWTLSNRTFRIHLPPATQRSRVTGHFFAVRLLPAGQYSGFVGSRNHRFCAFVQKIKSK